jgi:hypothetical protein
MEQHTEYYQPKSRGWGVAAFIVALAVACAAGAAYIHTTTYVHPTHPLRQAGGAEPGPQAGDVSVGH